MWDEAVSGRCWFPACPGAGLALGSIRMSRAVLGGAWAALQGEVPAGPVLSVTEGTALEVSE